MQQNPSFVNCLPLSSNELPAETQTIGIMNTRKSLINRALALHSFTNNRRPLENIMVAMHQSDNSATGRQPILLRSFKSTRRAWKSVLGRAFFDPTQGELLFPMKTDLPLCRTEPKSPLQDLWAYVTEVAAEPTPIAENVGTVSGLHLVSPHNQDSPQPYRFRQ